LLSAPLHRPSLFLQGEDHGGESSLPRLKIVPMTMMALVRLGWR